MPFNRDVVKNSMGSVKKNPAATGWQTAGLSVLHQAPGRFIWHDVGVLET